MTGRENWSLELIKRFGDAGAARIEQGLSCAEEELAIIDVIRWRICEAFDLRSAPDLVSRIDQRIPPLLDRIRKGEVNELCRSDAEVLAAEIDRLRTERDRVYWAAQVTARRIESGETTDQIWNEVTRG